MPEICNDQGWMKSGHAQAETVAEIARRYHDYERLSSREEC